MSRQRAVVNPEELRALYECGLGGRWISERRIAQELGISRHAYAAVRDQLRAAGKLDEQARARLAERAPRRQGGRQRDRVGYHPGGIAQVVRDGAGIGGILAASPATTGLPRRATRWHVRRILADLGLRAPPHPRFRPNRAQKPRVREGGTEGGRGGEGG